MLAGQDITPEFKQAISLIAPVIDKANTPAQKHILASIMFRIITDPSCIAKLSQDEKRAQTHLRGLVADKVILSLTKLLDVGGVRFGVNPGSVYMYPNGHQEMSVTVPEDNFKSGEHLLSVCLQSVLQQQGVDYMVDYQPAMRKWAINRATGLGVNYPVDGEDNYRRYLELCNPEAPDVPLEDVVLTMGEDRELLPAMEPSKTYVYDGKLTLSSLIDRAKEAIDLGAVFKFETASDLDADMLVDRIGLMSISPVGRDGVYFVAGEKADPMQPLVRGPECFSEFSRIFKIMSNWYQSDRCHIDEAVLREDHQTLYGKQDAKITSSPHMQHMLAKASNPAVFRQRGVPASAYLPADSAVPAPAANEAVDKSIWRKLSNCPEPQQEEDLFKLEQGHHDHIVTVLSACMANCKAVFNKTAPSVVPFTAGRGYAFVTGKNAKYPDCLRDVVNGLVTRGSFDPTKDCITTFIVDMMRGFDFIIKDKYNQNERKYLNLNLAFRRDLLYSMALFKLCQQPLSYGVGKGVYVIPATAEAKMKIMANL